MLEDDAAFVADPDLPGAGGGTDKVIGDGLTLTHVLGKLDVARDVEVIGGDEIVRIAADH